MEYEKRKVTVDQALYTASDIVHEYLPLYIRKLLN